MPANAGERRKERRRNPEQRAREEAALQKRIDEGLKGTFPASDPVAADSAALRARRARRR